jgi:helicase
MSQGIGGADKLFPNQLEILQTGILHSGFNCVIQMPTGSGKTTLLTHCMEQFLNNGRKLIYLSPTKALALQTWNKWKAQFPRYKIGIYTSDFSSGKKAFPIPFKEADILIMTPERLDACIRNWRTHWKWIPDVNVVVVDEFHLISDKQRGARLEGVLINIQQLNPFLRIIGLSATLGNRHELAEWLTGVEFGSTWRPIPIKVSKRLFKKALDKPEILLWEVEKSIEEGGQILVFVQSRKRSEQLTEFLQEYGIQCAFHHAGLDHVTRTRIETEFAKGTLHVLIATSTLEMGINFPVRKVILYDMQVFDGMQFMPLPQNNIWQRIGRAGRFGLDTTGEATVILPQWQKSFELREDYDPIKSAWNNPRYFAEQVILQIGCGFARTIPQLEGFIRRSLGFQQGRISDLKRSVDDLLYHELIEEYGIAPDVKLKVTKEGYLMVKHQLMPSTVFLFKRIIRQNWAYTFFDLLLLLSCSPDQETQLNVNYEELGTIEDLLSAIPSLVLSHVAQTSKDILQVENKRLLDALKKALITYQYVKGYSLDTLSEMYNVSVFEITKLRESLLRILLAFQSFVDDPEPSSKMDREEITLKEKVYVLSKMLEAGLNEEKITLTFIKGIGSKKAKILCAHKIQNIEELALANEKELMAIPKVSSNQANKWIEEALHLIKEKSALRYKETKTRNLLRKGISMNEFDVYRLRRAASLKVKRITVNQYEVTGGSEPHLINSEKNHWTCDCVDFVNGNRCKHVMAVKIYRKDPSILKAISQSNEKNHSAWSLQELWFQNQ